MRDHNAIPRILVLGLGNLIRSDDGAGVHAARLLMGNPRLPQAVEVIEGETAGLDLLAVIHDATHVLALDAVNTGAEPGTVTRFDLSGLAPLPGSPSVHQLGFADLLEALRWLDKADKRMVLLGLQPLETGWGDALSPAVAAALPQLVEAALVELEQWVPQPATST